MKDELRAARAAYLKARLRVERCNIAQQKLRDLHLKYAADHSAAKDIYDRLRDRFVEMELMQGNPDA